MKIILTVSVVFFAATSIAQNIGIGTSNPNSKALLDISSNTKGVLFPRMTTAERINNISSPPNGLLVYDTDKDEFYHYNGIAWKPLLNGDYWSRPITNRSRIANANDSVGIGTSSPTEWLDVDGNIRSRNNINADNDIRATGNVLGGNLVSLGNMLASGTLTIGSSAAIGSDLTVSGSSSLDGAVTTNSGLTINNTSGTVQLQASGVNKGFFQVSGTNLRMGTNSGNTLGSVIIRLNGNDRVQIDPSGDINIEGKITKTATTGFSDLLPLCYGRVSGGVKTSGTSNFSIHKNSTGNYTITCSGVTSNSVILTTPELQGWILPQTISSGSFQLLSFNAGLTLVDINFHFIVYTPVN